jgi:hypothetical protein
VQVLEHPRPKQRNDDRHAQRPTTPRQIDNPPIKLVRLHFPAQKKSGGFGELGEEGGYFFDGDEGIGKWDEAGRGG